MGKTAMNRLGRATLGRGTAVVSSPLLIVVIIALAACAGEQARSAESTFVPDATTAPSPISASTATPSPAVQPEPTASESLAPIVQTVSPTPTPPVTLSSISVPTATPMAAATQVPTHTPVSAPKPTSIASPTTTHVRVATLQPTAKSFPTAAPTSSPPPRPTETPVALPTLADLQSVVLEITNVRRERAGVPALLLGTNAAAQVHAESARDGCFTGHWGSDGTTPGMRYALAGGYQVNAENMTGLNYCIQPYENLQRIADLESAVRDAANGLMDSPDHYHIATAGQFKKVNLGIAWDNHIIWLVQQFEGGYVQFQRLPELKGTQLAFSGRTANGAKTDLDQNGLKVDIYYQPLGLLTRGQLASGYCLDVGEVLGTLIPPAPSGYSYGDLAAVPKTYERCHSPYQTSPTAKAPASYLEAKSQHDLSRILPNLVHGSDASSVLDTSSSGVADHRTGGVGLSNYLMWKP